MTLDEIDKRVREIRNHDDREVQRLRERELHHEALRAIADKDYPHGVSAASLARAAMDTIYIDFPRWYA